MNIKAVIVLTIAKSDELTAEAFVPDEFFLGFSEAPLCFFLALCAEPNHSRNKPLVSGF